MNMNNISAKFSDAVSYVQTKAENLGAAILTKCQQLRGMVMHNDQAAKGASATEPKDTGGGIDKSNNLSFNNLKGAKNLDNAMHNSTYKLEDAETKLDDDKLVVKNEIKVESFAPRSRIINTTAEKAPTTSEATPKTGAEATKSTAIAFMNKHESIFSEKDRIIENPNIHQLANGLDKLSGQLDNQIKLAKADKLIPQETVDDLEGQLKICDGLRSDVNALIVEDGRKKV